MSTFKNDAVNTKKPDKRWWRKLIAELNAELEPEYIEAASLEIQAKVMADPAFQRAGTVMLYMSTDREVSTRLLFDEILAMGKRLCVPLCTNKTAHEMKAIEVSGYDDLEAGAFGIPEPKRRTGGETSRGGDKLRGGETSPNGEKLRGGETSQLAIVEQGDIDYVICPCVSCDIHGNRLGHGAGYYDRWLENYEGRKIALCFGKLLQYELPVRENDVRMDEVIVERN